MSDNRLFVVEFAPHQRKRIDEQLITAKPKGVSYKPAYGDCSSHGATWENLRDSINDLIFGYRVMSTNDVERHLDGLIRMSVEGVNKNPLSWEPMAEGLFEARNDLLNQHPWTQEHLYEGLGYIAANFAERANHETASE